MIPVILRTMVIRWAVLPRGGDRGAALRRLGPAGAGRAACAAAGVGRGRRPPAAGPLPRALRATDPRPAQALAAGGVAPRGGRRGGPGGPVGRQRARLGGAGPREPHPRLHLAGGLCAPPPRGGARGRALPHAPARAPLPGHPPPRGPGPAAPVPGRAPADEAQPRVPRRPRRRPRRLPPRAPLRLGARAGLQDSAKGGAVETGCCGLHYIIGCFTIYYYPHLLHPPPIAPPCNECPGLPGRGGGSAQAPRARSPRPRRDAPVPLPGRRCLFVLRLHSNERRQLSDMQ